MTNENGNNQTDKMHIHFYGLCAFKKEDKVAHVLLHPGQTSPRVSRGPDIPVVNDGHDHVHASGDAGRHEATIMANLKDVDVDDERFWRPDRVVCDDNGSQFGIWQVPPRTRARVVASTGDCKETGQDHLQLGRYHVGAAVKSVDEAMEAICGLSVVSLVGGALAADRSRPLIVERPWDTDDGPALVGTRRTWSAKCDFIVLDSAHGAIPIRPGGTLNIANVARVLDPAGLAHVHHYYDFFSDYVPTARRIRLKPAPRRAEETVYDCVPPGDLP